MTLTQFISEFLGASAIEIVASIAGFICVFLLIKRSIWNFAFGFVQVSLYVWIFYQYKLYSDAMLHIVYIGLQGYGWWNWYHHKNSQQDIVIVKGNALELTKWLGISFIASLILGYIMSNYTDASFAYADAFTTCTSLVAQWLLTRRQLFNWLFWIAVDIVAIAVYWQKGLYPTSVLYGTFLIMSIVGFYTWWQQCKHQNLIKNKV